MHVVVYVCWAFDFVNFETKLNHKYK